MHALTVQETMRLVLVDPMTASTVTSVGGLGTRVWNRDNATSVHSFHISLCLDIILSLIFHPKCSNYHNWNRVMCT